MATFIEFKGCGGDPVAINPNNVFAVTTKVNAPKVTEIYALRTNECFNIDEPYETVLSKLREELSIKFGRE